MALICASSYSYIECVISQVKITGFLKKWQQFILLPKSDCFLFAGSSQDLGNVCAGSHTCFFLEQLGKILGVVSKSHLLGHVLYLVQTL